MQKRVPERSRGVRRAELHTLGLGSLLITGGKGQVGLIQGSGPGLPGTEGSEGQ